MGTSKITRPRPIAPPVVITREFDVPRDLVWKAWTDPKQMARWWGPHMFTAPVCELDVRPGGAIRIDMQGPTGPANQMKGTFIEVIPPEKLAFITSAFHDEKGEPGIETMNTATFTERRGKTTIKLETYFTKARPEFALAMSGQKAGWSQSLDRLYALVTDSPEFLLTRIFDAPRELVWKAYSETDRLTQWWGPKGYKMAKVSLDFRPGGVFHYGMQAPNGETMWGKFVYREIDAPERQSFVVSFSDEKGGTTRHPMSSTWPREVLSTITLFEIEGKTAVIMSSVPVNATADERRTFSAGFDGMTAGFTATLDQLEAYLASAKGGNKDGASAKEVKAKSTAKSRMTLTLPSDKEILITYTFDAPRALVFKAYTDPKLIPLWWGPRAYSTIVDKMDVRPGGVWRFLNRDDKGQEYAFSGVYREIVPPQRLVYTFEFEPIPGHVSLETVTLIESRGKTKVNDLVSFSSTEDRDGMIKSGMETGAAESLDRMAELIPTLK